MIIGGFSQFLSKKLTFLGVNQTELTVQNSLFSDKFLEKININYCKIIHKLVKYTIGMCCLLRSLI
jgi:hypothetical protein